MSNSNISDSIIFFTGEGTIADAIGGRIPNFFRPSPVKLDWETGDSTNIQETGAYYPAIYPSPEHEGAILVSPASHNLLTHSKALNNSVWVKGERVTVEPDEITTPAGDLGGDLVSWAPGTGTSQNIQRNIELEAEQAYTFTLLFRLQRGSGEFGNKDEIRFTGEVSESSQVLKLADFNKKKDRWILASFTVWGGGKQPKYPEPPSSENTDQVIYDYDIVSVTASTATLSNLSGVATDDFVGGTILFPDQTHDKEFQITSNTPSSNTDEVTITVAPSSLLTDGINNTHSAVFGPAPLKNSTLQIYCENTVSIHWGGCCFEPKPFRSLVMDSIFYPATLGKTEYSFRESPIAERRSFGCFFDFLFWRGAGNVLSISKEDGGTGNFVMSINEAGTLNVALDAVEVSYENLPEDAKVFIQLDESKTSLAIWVNGEKVAQESVLNYEGRKAPLNLSSEGIRAIKRLVFFDKVFLDSEISELFSSPVTILPLEKRSRHFALNLNTVTVPPRPDPTALATVKTINTGTRVISADTSNNFVVGDWVGVYRNEFGKALPTQITTRAVENTGANPPTITLDSVSGILPGDFITKGTFTEPGTQSVRFPYRNATSVAIENVSSNTITVESALSVTLRNALVVDPAGNEKREVLVEGKDNNARTLQLNDATDVENGDTFVQIEEGSELLVDLANCDVTFVEDLSNVKVGVKSRNAVVIENYNKYPVSVTPKIHFPTYG